MADILSNEELDTLLSAVDDGEISLGSGESRRREKRISNYDFKKPNRFSRDQLRVLQYMHKNASQLMSSSLASALRIGVEVQLVSIGQLTYEAFITSLADPICMNVVSLSPLEQMGVLTMDLPLAYAIMERMLGGPGDIPESVRPMTQLEETIVSQAIDLILQNLRDSWKDVVDLELKVERKEMNPGFVHVVPGPEIVLLITFSVGGQLASGEVKFCIPYLSLESILGKLGTEHMGFQSSRAKPTDRTFIAKHLEDTPIEFSAVLGTAELTIAELLSLQAGHVLRLDSKASDPVICSVEDQAKFLAKPGLSGSKVAVGVETVMESGERDEAPQKDSELVDAAG